MNEQDQTRNAQLAEMKSFLEAKVKAEPGNAEAWRELAQVKMMEGDIGGAENDCIECLRLDPKNAAGLVLMGNLLSNAKGDDAAAERYYARAVEADDRFASAHANYGTLLLKRGDKMGAVTELRKSIALDERQAVPRYMLAQAYAGLSDWHSAWLVAREALERGEVGFEDSANYRRVMTGLRTILDQAASRGGSEPPEEGENALEQSLRQADFDIAHEKGDPARNFMMAMYMLDAMRRLKGRTPEEVRNVAMEIAILGTRGIDPGRSGGYALKSLPGEDFSGYRLLAYYYVSWSMAFPEHLADIGLPFDNAYALALQMGGKSGSTKS